MSFGFPHILLRMPVCACLLAVALLGGCKVVYSDEDGEHLVYSNDFEDFPDVRRAMEETQQPPSAARLGPLTKGIDAKTFSGPCRGTERKEYLDGYRAIGLMQLEQYDFLASSEVRRRAHEFLGRCVENADPQLAGPAMLGLGAHGTKQDADAIFARAITSDERLLVRAAMGLEIVCDPVADGYLAALLERADDERVRKSIQTLTETRRIMMQTCANKTQGGRSTVLDVPVQGGELRQ